MWMAVRARPRVRPGGAVGGTALALRASGQPDRHLAGVVASERDRRAPANLHGERPLPVGNPGHGEREDAPALRCVVVGEAVAEDPRAHPAAVGVAYDHAGARVEVGGAAEALAGKAERAVGSDEAGYVEGVWTRAGGLGRTAVDVPASAARCPPADWPDSNTMSARRS